MCVATDSVGNSIEAINHTTERWKLSEYFILMMIGGCRKRRGYFLGSSITIGFKGECVSFS